MAYRFDIILSILKPIWFLPELSQFRVLKAAISFLQNEEIPTLEDAENVELAASLGVNSIPALFFYRNGKLEKQLIGYMSKDQLKAQLGL